ncbi:chaplin family protein [Streptomyces ziwulingensis]
MRTRTFARRAVVTATLLETAPAVSPARAGGVGDFLSPASGTSCANHHNAAQADGATTRGTGTATGNLAGLPIGSPLNQCGGADMPDVCTVTQYFPGTNILAGNVLNDAVEAPVDTTVQVVPLLSTDDVTSDKPIANVTC